MSWIIPFATVVIYIRSGLGLLVGIGLLRRDRWARPLALVVGILMLLKIPFGTALGIYGSGYWHRLNRARSMTWWPRLSRSDSNPQQLSLNLSVTSALFVCVVIMSISLRTPNSGR